MNKGHLCASNITATTLQQISLSKTNKSPELGKNYVSFLAAMELFFNKNAAL